MAPIAGVVPHLTARLKHYVLERDADYSRMTGDLAQLVGYERRARHYPAAIAHLDRSYKLGLTRIEREVLATLFTELADGAKRFSNDPHITPVKGEDSGVHQAMSVAFFHEVLRRSAPCADSDKAVTAMRLVISRMLLVHDVGEIFGEFSTVHDRGNGRSAHSADRSYKKLEFEIGVFAIRLAFLEHQRGDRSFVIELPRLREQMGVRTGAVISEQRIEELRAQLRTEARRLKLDQLTGKHRRLADSWVKIFYAAERPGPDLPRILRFCSRIAKPLERCQGTRYINREGERLAGRGSLRAFVTRPSWRASIGATKKITGESGGAAPLRIPLDLALSSRPLNGIRYMLSSLEGVSREAESPAELRLAREVRRAVELTIAESLSKGAPFLALVPHQRSAELESLQQRTITCPDSDTEALRRYALAVQAEQRMLYGLLRIERACNCRRSVVSKGEAMALCLALSRAQSECSADSFIEMLHSPAALQLAVKERRLSLSAFR